MANPSMGIEHASLTDRAGFWAAILTALLAAVSFGVAVTTPPRPDLSPHPAAFFPIPTPQRRNSCRATSCGCTSPCS